MVTIGGRGEEDQGRAGRYLQACPCPGAQRSPMIMTLEEQRDMAGVAGQTALRWR